ncbi:neuromedin-U receptor 2-like isoform X2 [Anneissia japonica]|nr:neuromedin-U receptor 2-like isoform X2 [Anneissia japonica]XP_033096036.1 neuromedin-U receptor 2-like isoform X2 [Anneissia japonica]XP_033096043.1 neuromedin-U receptor 2-like isoform X2 [Anneissia japonica]
MNTSPYVNTSDADGNSSGNFSMEEPVWDDIIQAYSYNRADQLVISIFMPMVVIIGIFGNVMTVIVIVKHLRTAVNVYLANLAITDTLYLLLAPDLIWISYLKSSVHDLYDIGSGILWFCRLNIYIVDTTLQVAIFTIFWMSVERYMAICHPFQFRKKGFGKRLRSIQLCCIMWLVALVWQARSFAWITEVSFQLPWPDMYNGIPNSTSVCVYCHFNSGKNCDIQNHLFDVDIFLSLIFVFVIIGMYTAIFVTLKKSHFTSANSTGTSLRFKSEKKVLQTVFLTVTIYIILMAPFRCLNIFNSYYDIHKFILQTVNIFRVANYLNSSVNPIIYNAVNEDFRKAFLDVFCCCNSKPIPEIRRAVPAITLNLNPV